ncbi:hypothetical protein [Methylomarinum vadi]|uniref:hypothetical protein n=1 Tax=Methylomarinum vadi TaxID=438855 RepID=UPI001267CF57|nr:hypothetical protein [Methylomarinum vadi]
MMKITSHPHITKFNASNVVAELFSVGREHKLRPLKNQKSTVIAVPDFQPESFRISGFVFSKRFLKSANLHSLDPPKTTEDWQRFMRYADLAKSIEVDSNGGPTVGTNKVLIEIDTNHRNAGSEASYIYLRFSSNHRVKLWGIDGTRFPKGWWIEWDLNNISDFLETIPTDAWDELFLENPSGDGMLLCRILIVHAGQTILDWRERQWLDGSKKERFGRIGLTAQILEKKLSYVNNNWIPQIHWAAREIGKTDWRKYGNESAWCSEFAAWCLRKAMWEPPTTAHIACPEDGGAFGSCTLENWFSDQDRKYTKSDLTNGDYRLIPGDYLRVNNGNHSALFVSYLDGDPFNGPSTLSPNTRIRTIEGNSAQTVRVKNNRTIAEIYSVGSTA